MTHNLVPSDRVLGMAVYGRNGEKLGTIERLMLDKTSGAVAYVVLRHTGFLGTGVHHYPLPWAALRYSAARHAYEADAALGELQAGVCELDGDDFDWGDRKPPYQHPSYWGV